jgi:phosphoribosyl 1,2-cyclic phosphate phosphodiesterase
LEILVCGTAAAEGWPALFCTCGACEQARKLGGKDNRSRAAYMVGERVRIDFGPDSYLHMQKYALAFEKLEHLLVTHSHDDHWFPRDLQYRQKGFSVVPARPLKVWGNAKVKARFVSANGNDWSRYFLDFHAIRPWESVDLGEGLTATALLAAHDRSEECVNYLLDQGGRSALIGHDTGWYDESTWQYLASRQLHLVLLDCTYGSRQRDQGHLGCPDVVRARDELASRGALAADAIVVATHFSHNGGWLHEELERFFSPHDIRVAFDGMRLTV